MGRDSYQTPGRLSELEREVMQIIWDGGAVSADDVRQRLEPDRSLKDSTVRTVLRRLEEKGYADHQVDGRTYVYRPLIRQTSAAAQAVRQIADRFCAGSVEELLLGLVDHDVVTTDQLRRLSEMIDQADGDRP